jgi:hypothetical protein
MQLSSTGPELGGPCLVEYKLRETVSSRAYIGVVSFCVASSTTPSAFDAARLHPLWLAHHGTHVRLVLARLVERLDGLLSGVPLGLLSVEGVEAWSSVRHPPMSTSTSRQDGGRTHPWSRTACRPRRRQSQRRAPWQRRAASQGGSTRDEGRGSSAHVGGLALSLEVLLVRPHRLEASGSAVGQRPANRRAFLVCPPVHHSPDELMRELGLVVLVVGVDVAAGQPCDWPSGAAPVPASLSTH